MLSLDCVGQNDTKGKQREERICSIEEPWPGGTST